MSSMKSGFSTLNRWLGKKNKDKSAPNNGKLSKSNTNLSSLSVSSININETSQLEYNRITPLPAATSNAPFEQTFRITVLLPKDQLYVARLGARVPLSKLLELVCDNKLLDAQKYEFRNPVDPSLVYSCDLTIGSVGLSEVRLCHKSESYDTFNTDEVIKLHRTALIRDSLSSSSEFSSRNSKLTTKTPSPYSSSNSLNSLDSTGMNYTRTPVTPPAALTAVSAAGLTASQKQLAAPPRKKRAAPRPPSQTAIPEKSALVITAPIPTTTTTTTETVKMESNNNNNNNNKAPTTLTRRELCMSTPNLTTPASIQKAAATIDCNGNDKATNGYLTANSNNNNNINDENISDEELHAQRNLEAQRNSRNSYIGGSVQTLYGNASTDERDSVALSLPEPSPRKRMTQLKKKVAPAPPPRGAGMTDDAISIASTTVSLSERTTMEAESMSAIDDDDDDVSPKPTKREQTPTQTTITATPAPAAASSPSPTPGVAELPKPVPRSTTTTLLNSSETTTPAPVLHATVTVAPPALTTTTNNNNNVSKVLLNRTPTPEPRSLTSEPTSMDEAQTPDLEDDNVSKQADSGIGEPVPSPLPDSLPSESSAHETKSNFESSSDDDDATVKVYNFKLGKTAVVQPHLTGDRQPTLEELAQLVAAETDNSSGSAPETPAFLEKASPNTAGTEVTTWNFAIPILPPPNFADSATDTATTAAAALEPSGAAELPTSPTPTTDVPIKPKIKARPVLNFETFEEPDRSTPDVKPPPKPITPQTKPSTAMNEIFDELSTIIQENRMDMLIKKKKNTELGDEGEIEAAKPNTLVNFSIGAASSSSSMSSTTTTKVQRTTNESTAGTIIASESPPSSEREKVYRRNSSSTQQQQQQQQQPQQQQQQQQQHQQQQQRRRSVTRADSFQTSTSTGKLSETLTGLLNRRSSSQLSLSKVEQNGLQLNRRRSSSELSIGESPSLQSPEVVKSILGSRKNSLANISDNEAQDKRLQQQTQLSLQHPAAAEKPKIVQDNVVEYNCTDSKSNSGTTTSNNDTKAATLPKPVSNDMMKTATLPPKSPKEIPKTYRYSGPPSINFSTWNERPKVQVSIKNEGDYIFGGKNANRQNATNNNSGITAGGGVGGLIETHTTTASSPFTQESQSSVTGQERQSAATDDKLTIDAAMPILRMGIPRKEFKVPITVKPLRDVTVDNVTLATQQQQQQHQPKFTQVVSTKNNSNRTTIEIVAQSTSNGNGDGGGGVSIATLRPQQTSTTTATSATLPRHYSANRFTMPAVTLRSTSVTQLKAATPATKTETTTTTAESVSPAVANAAPTAPFGQGTLRRTGFKEKMLAKEQQEQERTIRKSDVIGVTSGAQKSTVLIQSPMQTTTPTEAIATTKTVIKSTKLELKLQQSNTAPPPPSVVLTSSVTLNKVAKPSVVPSAPVPPPAPALHTLKPVAARTPTTTSPTADPRSQLLDAIRNFKREELNRS